MYLTPIKIRILILIYMPIMFFIWWIPTNGVWGDYQNLINQTDEIRLSLITLIVPIGFLGALITFAFMGIKSFFYGKKVNEVFSENAMKLSNKICIYSGLLGVVFAVVFALYSMKLLDEYGYEYSYELTDITPTGIHLIYVKTQ
ncbi:hypothetical protein [Aliivibrio fischeri]|uniref:hypothetical protein n=1 Tax=Aliivibrio fischeri TaxID=668 RepID=UPI0007C4C3AD|nr:hypothetical protein [Aliivibrio fischeri]